VGRLEDKYEEDEEVTYFEPDEEQQTYQQLPQQYRRPQGIIQKVKHTFKNFGFSKNSYQMATDIENNPSPEGALRVSFSGRPLDLHMLEDYLVWKTSPLEIKTILRYGHAKAVEDFRGLFTAGQRAKGNPKMLIMIVLAIILMIGGIFFLMYGPNMGALLGF